MQNYYPVSCTAGLRFSLGPGAYLPLALDLQASLVSFYGLKYPGIRIYEQTADIDRPTGPPNFIRSMAYFHQHVIIDGRKIVPSTDIYRASNSIVQMGFSNAKYVGQVQCIFTHSQSGIDHPSTLLHILWFDAMTDPIFNTTIWDLRYVYSSIKTLYT